MINLARGQLHLHRKRGDGTGGWFRLHEAAIACVKEVTAIWWPVTPDAPPPRVLSA